MAEKMHELLKEVTERVDQVILGKQEQVQLALCSLFARGHLLIEDIPGIGKTTLAKVLAEILGLDFRRVQCTSDMLPGDILGVSVFEQKSGQFIFHPGPIFTQVLLSDEINRTTPKTQSALLEAMEEQQITIEGKSYPLPSPFFVIATLNPLEQAGTFPLPESQLDRFLFRIKIGYPDRAAELKLLRGGGTQKKQEEIKPLLTPEKVTQCQEMAAAIHISDTLVHYVQSLLEFSRTAPDFYTGLSPRAGLSLIRASQSWALINGRAFVLPEDVQKVLPYVATHRLRRVDSLTEMTGEELLELFASVPVPP
ncbi:MAG: MoxR family ATPase [Thermodesulfobacteriota bacterium]